MQTVKGIFRSASRTKSLPGLWRTGFAPEMESASTGGSSDSSSTGHVATGSLRTYATFGRRAKGKSAISSLLKASPAPGPEKAPRRTASAPIQRNCASPCRYRCAPKAA